MIKIFISWIHVYGSTVSNRKALNPVSLDVKLRIHQLKSNRLLWLTIPSCLINLSCLLLLLSTILRSGKTEAVRRDYFCPQLISPPRSSKLMWPHPPLLKSTNLTRAVRPTKAWTSQNLRDMVSVHEPVELLTTWKREADAIQLLASDPSKLRESFAKCERHSELSRKECLILI